MPRKAASAPKAKPVATNAKFAEAVAAGTAVAVINTQSQKAAVALASQVGYDGDVSVTGCEQQIRFYQHRTVEASISLGRALLVLKELTQHGEFTERIEHMGFHERAAQRFMGAAAKVAKNTDLQALVSKVKSTSAFLELLTVDDGKLKALNEMDAVDKMSASELRAALREANAEVDTKDRLIERKNKKIDELATARAKLPEPTPDSEAAALVQDAHEAEATACCWIEGHLNQTCELLITHDAVNETDHRPVLSGFLARIEQAVQALRIRHGIALLTLDPALDPNNIDVPPKTDHIERPVPLAGGRHQIVRD